MKSLAEVIIEPILVDSETAARLCGVSRSTWLAWDASGINPKPVRIIGRVLWCVGDLRRWAAEGCPSRAQRMEGYHQ